MKAQNLIILGIAAFVGYKFILKPMQDKAKMKKAQDQQNAALSESDMQVQDENFANAAGNMSEVYGWNNAQSCDKVGQHCLVYDNWGNPSNGVYNSNCQCVSYNVFYGRGTKRSTSIV